LHVSGSLCVSDRGEVLPVRGAPVGRTAEQHRDPVGLGVGELAGERLADEMVTAVPLAVAVERDDEPIRALQRLEERG
jgi:hypothetical protein